MTQPNRYRQLEANLRGAVELAERFQAKAELLRAERDELRRVLESFENRRELARGLTDTSPQVAAFVEATGWEMDKFRTRPFGNKEYGSMRDALFERLDTMGAALKSIATNGCCGPCQEARLVAQAALAKVLS